MDNIIEQDTKRIIQNICLDELVGKSVLVTGASGLIGTYLLYTLWQFQNQCVSEKINKVYAVIHSVLPEHLEIIADCDWIEFIRGDLSDEGFLDSLPCCDYIIHASGYAQPSKFMSDRLVTLKLNTMGTIKLGEKLNDNGKMVFISSSAVYTGCDSDFFTEDEIGCSNTNHPRACYIEGKRCGEAICNAFRSMGKNVKAARFSIVYGPGTKKGDVRALNSFIREAVTEHHIELLDSGNAQKIYCYISDAVEMLLNILLNGTSDIYNVAGHSQVSIYELACLVAQYTGSTVTRKENVDDGVKGAIAVEHLSMKKTEAEFGKTNYVSIEDGLKRTIDWAKANIYC